MNNARPAMHPNEAREVLPLVVHLLAAWTTNVPSDDGANPSAAQADGLLRELAIRTVLNVRQHLIAGTSPIGDLPDAASIPSQNIAAARAWAGAEPTPIVHEWPEDAPSAAPTLPELPPSDPQPEMNP